MNTSLFLISLAVAIAAPVLAVTYLRTILITVLRELCDSESGAEFWIRCTYLLAVSGSVLLMLVFGEFRDTASVVDALRRSLVLVFAAIFVTVGLVSRNVWQQVRRQQLPLAALAAPDMK